MTFMNRKDPFLLLLGIGVSNLGAWVYRVSENTRDFSRVDESASFVTSFQLC
ncbi:hypothetical protein [Oceanobacillus locisalsi]|uniref:Uncharacterized protein n=1 Tax=Oceanobacillus locisalsi TaxID=546107 RepID=A0ABW3NL45_9BACI